MAERTRMRRIRRIGPIYGATCHRSGFCRCEISPAMVPCGTREVAGRIRDKSISVYTFGMKSLRKKKRKKNLSKNKKINIYKKITIKLILY